MIRHVQTALLLAATLALLSGCVGWAHPMGGGPHHGRWDDDRPYGPGYRCSDEQRAGTPGQPPCPYRR
jgi:hypothetical protein